MEIIGFKVTVEYTDQRVITECFLIVDDAKTVLISHFEAIGPDQFNHSTERLQEFISNQIQRRTL